ncbi:MAG: hypothetical protein EKK29_09050 [Hyphomicrobiales bacterium]|nr:MAG: hypothetical protein EKK29_09050 [Hyphomicrobiales bacterium]
MGQTQDSITLSTRVTIEVRPANFRTVRGGTVIAAICDEVAYWRSDSLANPDSEILAALRPALATTRGMIAAISSPYARKGEVWFAYKQHYGEFGDTRSLLGSGSKTILARYACFWRSIAVFDDSLQTLAISGRNLDENSGAHDSHANQKPGIRNSTSSVRFCHSCEGFRSALLRLG